MPNFETAPTEEQISADHSEAKRIDLAQDLQALANEQQQAGYALAAERTSASAKLIEMRGANIHEQTIDEGRVDVVKARENVAEAIKNTESSLEAA